MKETNTNEQLFDGLFREELGNASSPVPPGVWEGIASSVSGTSAITTAASAGKIAVWMKAAVSVVIASAITVGVYQLQNDKKSVQDTGGKNTGVQEVITEDSKTPADEVQVTGTEELQTPSQSDAKTEPNNTKPLSQNQYQSPYSGGGLKFTIPSDNNGNYTPVKIMPDKTQDPDENVVRSEDPITDYYEPEKDPGPEPEFATPKPAGRDSSEILVPNTVTPNGDGSNDTYLIRIVNEERVEIIIYDPTSNEILFRTKNKYQGWNCNMPNGDPAPAGSYIVKVIYKFRAKPEAEPIYTRLTILR